MLLRVKRVDFLKSLALRHVVNIAELCYIVAFSTPVITEMEFVRPRTCINRANSTSFVTRTFLSCVILQPPKQLDSVYDMSRIRHHQNVQDHHMDRQKPSWLLRQLYKGLKALGHNPPLFRQNNL